jgi:hypothetical protein
MRSAAKRTECSLALPACRVESRLASRVSASPAGNSRAEQRGVVEEYVYNALQSTAADPETMEKLLLGFTEAIRFPDT